MENKKYSTKVIENIRHTPIPTPPVVKYPDAKKHQIISFIKSGIRIVGYIILPFDLVWAASILVASEFIGIIEELV